MSPASAARLYSAEPCDATDPAPGVRLLREGARLGRLSATEALALAGDLVAASVAVLAGEADNCTVNSAGGTR